MNLFIGFLTLVLVLDCLFLMLLVLVQLPKKEAGMGQAFGGGATDALFGAGSGNALTKLTKWAAGTFLVLCLLVSVLNAQRTGTTRTRIQQELQKQGTVAPVTPPPAPAAAPAVNMLNSNVLTTPAPASNAAPAAPAPAAVTPPAPKAATTNAAKTGK